jgi:ketosteroid isomerase-like protein
MTSQETKLQLARAFHQALLTRDWQSLRSIMAPDVTWTLPGENLISGTASGIDQVIERAKLIASYGPSFELLNILVSRDNMALAIHNQATRGELILDEYLATVCTISDSRISNIETYLSDVEGMNAFFASPPPATK